MSSERNGAVVPFGATPRTVNESAKPPRPQTLAYICSAVPIDRMAPMAADSVAFIRARSNRGVASAAMMAMIVIAINNSISVNPASLGELACRLIVSAPPTESSPYVSPHVSAFRIRSASSATHLKLQDPCRRLGPKRHGNYDSGGGLTEGLR